MAAEKSGGKLRDVIASTDPDYYELPLSHHIENSFVKPGTKKTPEASGDPKIVWYNVSTSPVAGAPPKRTPNPTKRSR